MTGFLFAMSLGLRGATLVSMTCSFVQHEQGFPCSLALSRQGYSTSASPLRIRTLTWILLIPHLFADPMIIIIFEAFLLSLSRSCCSWGPLQVEKLEGFPEPNGRATKKDRQAPGVFVVRNKRFFSQSGAPFPTENLCSKTNLGLPSWLTRCRENPRAQRTLQIPPSSLSPDAFPHDERGAVIGSLSKRPDDPHHSKKPGKIPPSRLHGSI